MHGIHFSGKPICSVSGFQLPTLDGVRLIIGPFLRRYNVFFLLWYTLRSYENTYFCTEMSFLYIVTIILKLSQQTIKRLFFNISWIKYNSKIHCSRYTILKNKDYKIYAHRILLYYKMQLALRYLLCGWPGNLELGPIFTEAGRCLWLECVNL